MDSEKKFRTKTGFCHILPDKIVLTRDGVIGSIAQVTDGNIISGRLIIYSVFALGLFYIAYKNYEAEEIFGAVLSCLLAIFLSYGVLTSLNNSASPVIERNKIKNIKFKKAIEGVTRSRFEVYFEVGNGKIKKRLIMLPGALTGRQNETEKAIKIMTEEKLIAF